MTEERLGGHDVVEGLTGRPPWLHSATTPEEVQRVQIDRFLDALADVALSVAARSLQSRTGEDVA